MNFKKFAALATVLLFGIAMLTGCGATQPSNSDTTAVATTAAQAETTVKTDQKLLSLRNEIKENNFQAGMAFIGGISKDIGEKELREFMKSSLYAVKYSFLCDAPIVDAGGTELYAVITPKMSCRASVYKAEMNGRGEYDIFTDKALYKGKGMDCFLLRCNVSDLHSNAVVSFKNGDKVFSVFPMISGANGKLIAENCYDFSVNADDGKVQNDVAIAQSILLDSDEIKYYIDKGMTLQYTGRTQEIDGRSCWIFALGTDHGDNFVREFYYGVCDNLIYSYDAVSDSWNVLGAG
ncbi:MAG TPA: hypothetical protein DCY15_05905 [Ruminococcaceae bacterium]|nr:hypothetical protein [Oscillospiraceae bacterium]